jgi:hypothetical protein
MTIPLPELWQMRRSALNHNWLQNRYLVFLLALRQCAIDGFSDPGFEARALEGLREWEAHRVEFDALLGSPDAMGPRQLLAIPPLDRLGETDRAWVGDVAHNCWMSRGRIEVLFQQANALRELADRLYGEVVETFARARATESHFGLSSRESIGRFHSACSELSQAISRLPSRLEIA